MLNPDSLFIIPVILVALVTGSFLSVCIYRVPYGRPKGPPGWEDEESDLAVADAPKEETKIPEKLSIWYPPRSFCPQCNKQLYWWHNIPVVSWLLLGGRCAFCKTPIPVRYPTVELLTLLFGLLSIGFFGYTPTALLIFIFCCTLIVISFIDIDYYIIPDVISIPGTALSVVIAALNHYFHWFAWPIVPNLWSSFIGLLFGGGVLLVISEVYLRIRKREGLGLGDVKLLALTGALFGIEGALYTMFVGSLVGSVLGILLIVLSGKKMSYQLPFGPYLALGTILYIFASPWFVDWPHY